MKIHALFNVLLLLYLVSFPVLLYLNKKVLKGKNKDFNKAMKMGRKIHPYVGITLVVSGFIHGYLKLGGQLYFHTGVLLLTTLAISGVLGYLYKKKKKKELAKLHRMIGFVIVGLFLLHYFNPWLFGFR